MNSALKVRLFPMKKHSSSAAQRGTIAMCARDCAGYAYARKFTYVIMQIVPDRGEARLSQG